MSKEINEIMTSKEVAAYLRLHLKSVYRLAKQKKIPGSKIGGVWRFSRVDIDEYMKEKSES